MFYGHRNKQKCPFYSCGNVQCMRVERTGIMAVNPNLHVFTASYAQGLCTHKCMHIWLCATVRAEKTVFFCVHTLARTRIRCLHSNWCTQVGDASKIFIPPTTTSIHCTLLECLKMTAVSQITSQGSITTTLKTLHYFSSETYNNYARQQQMETLLVIIMHSYMGQAGCLGCANCTNGYKLITQHFQHIN